jgi:two-component system sensor histidine kinase KdpD
VEARALEGGGVELRVADDGRGIPDRHLDHVFDPFYTDGKVGGGSGYGLGLSIVHNAVIGPLGGTIGLDSREGDGTTVTIVLPTGS